MEDSSEIKPICTFIGIRQAVMKDVWEKMRQLGVEKATRADFKKFIGEAWKEAKLKYERKCV
jgi:hypothetical protein